MKSWMKPILGISVILAGCTPFIDTTPQNPSLPELTPLTTPAKLWVKNVSQATTQDCLRFVLASDEQRLITVHGVKTLVSLDVKQGKALWRIDLPARITSGVAVGQGLVAVVTEQPTLYLINEQTGQRYRSIPLSDPVLAAPTIAADKVLVKTIRDRVLAFNIDTKQLDWQFAVATPPLHLRVASAPVVVDDKVILGLSNGDLFMLSLDQGTILTSQTLAHPQGINEVQRMVDIASDPVWVNGRLYVANYHGLLMALTFPSIKPLWQRAVSSYTGMVVTDHDLLITDTLGRIWSLQTSDGAVNWQQTALMHRYLTAPAVNADYVVVGDAQGYVHVLSRQTGALAARFQVGKNAIVSTPVVQGKRIYVLDCQGNVAAYQIE